MAPFVRGKLGIQYDVDPVSLGRGDRVALDRRRYVVQLQLIDSGIRRASPIKINEVGRIIDGHHGTRAAIDRGVAIEVEVVAGIEESTPPTVREMPFLK